MHGPIECLTGERLQMDAAIRITIEETSKLVLQLMNAFNGGIDQRPGEVLIVEPFPALDGIHEMAFNGVAVADCNVVTPLHHARATALAEKALDRNRDIQIRRRLMGVERGKKSSAPTAKNQNIRLVPGNGSVSHCRRLPLNFGQASAREFWLI